MNVAGSVPNSPQRHSKQRETVSGNNDNTTKGDDNDHRNEPTRRSMRRRKSVNRYAEEQAPVKRKHRASSKGKRRETFQVKKRTTSQSDGINVPLGQPAETLVGSYGASITESIDKKIGNGQPDRKMHVTSSTASTTAATTTTTTAAAAATTATTTTRKRKRRRRSENQTTEPRFSILDGMESTPIYDFHDNDVLAGRGGVTNTHVGNRFYRDVIEHLKPYFNKIKKRYRKLIAPIVSQRLQNQDPPTRFLCQKKTKEKAPSKDAHGRDEADAYYVMAADGHLKKISQALREQRKPGSTTMESPSWMTAKKFANDVQQQVDRILANMRGEADGDNSNIDDDDNNNDDDHSNSGSGTMPLMASVGHLNGDFPNKNDGILFDPVQPGTDMLASDNGDLGNTMEAGTHKHDGGVSQPYTERDLFDVEGHVEQQQQQQQILQEEIESLSSVAPDARLMSSGMDNKVQQRLGDRQDALPKNATEIEQRIVEENFGIDSVE